jgi:ssDNA thymidine ADP-ribosyltransferase, DarT
VSGLNPDKALVFRITHLKNVLWVLEHGLHCRNSDVVDPNYEDIGNPELIDKRAHREVPIYPGGTLSDYIPFYFTPYSPMLLNIKTGYGGMKQTPMSQIAILVCSLRNLVDKAAFVFTDRHAYLATAEYYSDLADLRNIDWVSLQRRDFKRDPNHPEKFERYQAEALIHRHLPIELLSGIVCKDASAADTLKVQIQERALKLQSLAQPRWFF